jgi:hypothetical protein
VYWLAFLLPILDILSYNISSNKGCYPCQFLTFPQSLCEKYFNSNNQYARILPFSHSQYFALNASAGHLTFYVVQTIFLISCKNAGIYMWLKGGKPSMLLFTEVEQIIWSTAQVWRFWFRICSGTTAILTTDIDGLPRSLQEHSRLLHWLDRTTSF